MQSCLKPLTLKKFTRLKSANWWNLLPMCHGEYSPGDIHSNKRQFHCNKKWSHIERLPPHLVNSSTFQLFPDRNLHTLPKIPSYGYWLYSFSTERNCAGSITVQHNTQSKHLILPDRWRNPVLYLNSSFPTVCKSHRFSTDHSSNKIPNTEHNRRKKESFKIKDKVEDDIEKENIITIPNIITMSRILVTPYLGYLVIQESFTLACGLFVLAGFSDLLDGWIARNFKNQTSACGSFLDPLADKLLISILFITLSISNVIPVPLTTLVLARDLVLIIAAFYIRFVSLPPPRTLTTYFDATNVSAQLKPLFISKINTAFQISLIAVSLAAPVFDFLDHPLLHALWYATAGTTFASGIFYMLYAKDTFKILNKTKL